MSSIVTTVSENGGVPPLSILWAPKGEHFIRAKIGGAKRVVVTAACVERLNRDLAEKKSAGSKPVGYYDHSVGAASYLPDSFTWDEEKGVVLNLEKWTNRGADDVAGASYGYHSPFFLHDSKTNEILGLVPDSAEVGSLVNEPAFETIERIAASREILAPAGDGDKDGNDSHNDHPKAGAPASQTQRQSTMISKLVSLGILTEEEAKGENAQAVALDKIKALKKGSDDKPGEIEAAKKGKDDAEAKAKKAEAECAAAKAELEEANRKASELSAEVAAAKEGQAGAAKAMIAEAVAAGKLAPKSPAIEELEKSFAGNTSGLATVLSGMPVNPAFANATGGSKTTGNEDKELHGFDAAVDAFKE